MMKDPSYCYKFYWLEAIVQLISEGKKDASYNEIINEMISMHGILYWNFMFISVGLEERRNQRQSGKSCAKVA